MLVSGVARLTADPELKTIQSGDREVSLVKFSVAYNEYRRKDGEKVSEAHFFDCEAWDSGAEVIAKHVKKGEMLYIEGRLRQQRWEKDGEKRSKVVIRVTNFNFTSSKGSGEAVESAPAPKNDTVSNEVDEDEDVPF